MRKARPLIFLVSWANAQELVNALGIICNDTCCRQAFVKVTAAASRVAPRWIFCRKHNICLLWRLGWSRIEAIKPWSPKHQTTPQVGNEAQTGPQVVVLCDTNGPRTRATAERCCQLSLLWSLSLTKYAQPAGGLEKCLWLRVWLQRGQRPWQGHDIDMVPLDSCVFLGAFGDSEMCARLWKRCRHCYPAQVRFVEVMPWCFQIQMPLDRTTRTKCVDDNWIALPFARYSNATTVTMLSGVLSMPARQNLLFAQQHAKLYVLLPTACA